MIFFIKKWFKRRHFFIDEKNLQKLGLTGELISVNSYYMTIRSFQSQFLVLQGVNQWLTVVNFCVNCCFKLLNHCSAVLSNVFVKKLCQKLCAIGKIFIR